MRLTVRLVFLLFLFTTVIRAQSSVAGTWSDATLTLELKTDRDNLTGVVTEGQTGRFEISNGSVDGSKLRFSTNARLNGNDVVIEWNGEVKGDELTLTRGIPSLPPPKRPYPPFNGPFVLHRST
jgi:hypothetical protein